MSATLGTTRRRSPTSGLCLALGFAALAVHPASAAQLLLSGSVAEPGPFARAARVIDSTALTIGVEVGMSCPEGTRVTELRPDLPGPATVANTDPRIFPGDPGGQEDDFRVVYGEIEIAVEGLLEDDACDEDGSREDVETQSFTVVGRCSAGSYEPNRSYYFNLGRLECESGVPSNVHDPTVRTNPGGPGGPPPRPRLEAYFVADLDNGDNGNDGDSLGYGLGVSLFQPGRSTVDLTLAWHEEPRLVDVYDLELLWRYTAFDLGDRTKLRTVLGPGVRFTADADADADEPTFAPVAGLRLEHDLGRRLTLSLEARHRWLLRGGEDDGEEEDEVRFGLGFRFGR